MTYKAGDLVRLAGWGPNVFVVDRVDLVADQLAVHSGTLSGVVSVEDATPATDPERAECLHGALVERRPRAVRAERAADPVLRTAAVRRYPRRPRPRAGRAVTGYAPPAEQVGGWVGYELVMNGARVESVDVRGHLGLVIVHGRHPQLGYRQAAFRVGEPVLLCRPRVDDEQRPETD